MSDVKYPVLQSFRHPDKNGVYVWYEPEGSQVEGALNVFTGTPGSPVVQALLAGDVNTGPLIAEPEKKAGPAVPASKEN